jgi:Family of unknown function (DUF6326)
MQMKKFEDTPIDIKQKISALWITMLFLFAYVDIFMFYKPGVLEGIIGGQVAIFAVTQTFLLLTTLYIVIPSLMVFLSLILRARINRWVNMTVGTLYALTIALSCIGETHYFYIFGSLLEVGLIALIIWYAWNWPEVTAE